MSGITTPLTQKPGFVPGTYDGQIVRLATVGNALPGLFASGDFVVSQRAAGANLSVDVGAGRAFVDPQTQAQQGVYLAVLKAADAPFNTLANGGYTWSASHATLPRIDLVCIEVQDTDFGGAYTGTTIRIVDGTANAGATHQLNVEYWPSIPTGCVPIAAVLRPATSTTISTSQITNLNAIGSNRASAQSIATTETTASTSFTRLTTPDFVCAYVPSDGRIRLMYEALWKVSSASGTQTAAVFINGVQLTRRLDSSGAPVAQNVNVLSLATLYSSLVTSNDYGGANVGGLTSNAGSTSDVTENATGMLVSSNSGSGTGIEIIGLPAGWYVVEARFKTTANTISVQKRRMWAEVVG